MAGEVLVTIVGNATADAEIRYPQSGKPVANLTIASTPRTFDRQANEWKDGEPLFLRVSIWDAYAENVAATVTKGMRLVVTGRLKQRSYEDKEGNKRTVVELDADEIGPSLRYAQAAVQRIQRDSSQTRQQPSAYQQEQEEAWASPQRAQAAGVTTGQPTFDEPWATPGAANDYSDEPF